MANRLILKKSSVASKVPLAADLSVGELAVNLVDQKLYSKKADGTVVLVGSGLGGAGDVQGPASSTDNAIARFDLSTGKIIQNSSATIDDSGNLSATTSSATGTGANKMPVGTTAQRPASPQTGMYRMNSTTGEPEWYDTSSATWIPFGDRLIYSVEYLIVAGGGAGGTANGGAGGGAGGYRTGTASLRKGDATTIVVGAGGARGLELANNGSDSSFAAVSSVGGGGGGSGGTASTAGRSGGSGGGGTRGSAAGSGTSGQGNAGGGSAGSGAYGTGGGGGAASTGITGTTGSNGGGGNGNQWSNGNYYAGGGGGGRTDGGLGGVTSGGLGGGGGTGTNGTANTGGGGGGGDGFSGANSGSGGSGIVIVRYAGDQRGTGGTVTSAGGYTYHTFTSSGTFTA